MIVFVVNCGSSSIKYQLYDMSDESTLAGGLLQRVGTAEASLLHKAGGREHARSVRADDHSAGMRLIIDALVDPQIGVLSDVGLIDGIGHRVVHGGEEISGSVLIDENTLDVIEKNARLAPLHNPPNLSGIRASMQAIPSRPNVAVFDTAFLATLEPRAYRYAVPRNWYEQYGVRKYGFHGTSHRYVTLRAAELLGKPLDELNVITVHLGNGCSMTAVRGGKAVDHSMGMTPLDGLVMGTRSGHIDPAITLYMQAQGLSAGEVDRVLNKESGLLGVSEVSNDMRDCLSASAAGDERAALAIDIFIYRIVLYIGAYYAILPDLDAVVLTGGIGENAVAIRRRLCASLGRLGAVPDERRNAGNVGGKAGAITADSSGLAVWVIPTNEELLIARDTRDIVEGLSNC